MSVYALLECVCLDSINSEVKIIKHIIAIFKSVKIFEISNDSFCTYKFPPEYIEKALYKKYNDTYILDSKSCITVLKLLNFSEKVDLIIDYDSKLKISFCN
jgi:hypothetical protein